MVVHAQKCGSEEKETRIEIQLFASVHSKGMNYRMFCIRANNDTNCSTRLLVSHSFILRDYEYLF